MKIRDTLAADMAERRTGTRRTLWTTPDDMDEPTPQDRDRWLRTGVGQHVIERVPSNG